MKTSMTVPFQQIIMASQHISPDVIVKRFKSAAYQMKRMGLRMIYCGMTLKRLGIIAANVKK
jgi:hypothetical protein